MGKIILNNIEYGTGTPNSSNVDTTNLVKKDNIVTVIDENVTDEQIPSAKAVHTAIQNVSGGVPVNAYTKEEVDNLLDDKVNVDDLVDSYSKTEVDNLLDTKADSTDIIDAYDKTEIDGLLANKANTDDLDGKLDKTAIVTSVSSTSTDAQVPTAKAVHTAIQNVSGGVSTEQLEQAIQEAKTELENEITNIPKVTKTSELTNDSGFITEVDLEPYALKTQIPTTLPASDVYDWAKEATKPTYTASEVGALASNGTATNASKVANALTLQVNGVTNLTYDGSVARTFNLANASTSISGVMTPAMVTKLDGIETGATKTTVTNNLTSTSTTSALSAYQGKVLNDELQSLKTTSVNGKQTVADAINGKCGTSLTSATTYDDMAYYINNISTGAISKNYILATSGSISQKIKLAIIVVKAVSQSFTLEFASAMSGYVYYASHTGNTYDSRSSFTSTTTELSNTVNNTTAIIVFDKPVAISSITCSSNCRGIFIY